jgi:hypothetical protein
MGRIERMQAPPECETARGREAGPGATVVIRLQPARKRFEIAFL